MVSTTMTMRSIGLRRPSNIVPRRALHVCLQVLHPYRCRFRSCMMRLPAPIWPLCSTHPLRTKLFRRLHWLWCGVLHAHIMPMGPDFFKSLPFQQLFRLDRKKMARFGTWLGTDHRKRLPLRWLMAQRPEKRAQSLGNQLRLLQENELPAAPKVDPTSDIGIDPLQIFALGTLNLLPA